MWAAVFQLWMPDAGLVEEVALNLCKVFFWGNISHLRSMLSNPTEEAFVEDDSPCREFRFPLLGSKGQESRVSAGPQSSSWGAAVSQTSPECSYDIHSGRNLPCAAVLSLTTLMGCNMNHPTVTEWLFVDCKKKIVRVNSVNWIYSFGNFSWSYIWDLHAFSISMSCKCQKKLNMQVMKQTFGWPLRETKGYVKQEQLPSRVMLFWQRWPKLPFLIILSIQRSVLGFLLF